MSSDRESPIGPTQRTPPKRKGMSQGWRGWGVLLGALCVLGVPGSVHSADFNFDNFTKNKPFTLNTLPTTPYGPAWADILIKPPNFVACKGAKIALCYYSGPEAPITTDSAPTPCNPSGPGIANCTCYAIPEGNPYYVDINAILNLDVYLDTVQTCGSDGSLCQPTGNKDAPVCQAINNKSLVPGADLISTFSLALDGDYPLNPQNTLQCPDPSYQPPFETYAGCMTAPCKALVDPNTGKPSTDPVTGLELAQCACPTFTGPYQVGFPADNTCVLGGNNVWSAAFTVPPQPPIPPITGPDCLPDAPGGCPLLPPNTPFPPPPSDVSCQTVCSEYAQSNQNGIQVGFTCDATLCTASSDPALVESACGGLAKHSVSEILKLEIEVGFSCSASQICGCQPNKKTNKEIGALNAAQSDRGIVSQCAYNQTLCGTPP